MEAERELVMKKKIEKLTAAVEEKKKIVELCRDELRDLVDQIKDLIESWDSGIEGLDEGIRAFRDALDDLSEFV